MSPRTSTVWLWRAPTDEWLPVARRVGVTKRGVTCQSVQQLVAIDHAGTTCTLPRKILLVPIPQADVPFVRYCVPNIPYTLQTC
eukprot:5864449-Amphidinium_carterae.2